MTVEIGFPAPDVLTAELSRMVDLQLASRIAARDADIWGEDAAELAANRLGWTDLHTRAAGLIEQIHALRDELAAEGIDRFVLAGMGGSSLGAEVIARAHNADLLVIDSTDPHDIATLCESEELPRFAMVVATKSGTTIETVSAASAFAQGLLSRGIDPRTRLIAVTDPDTPMAEQALEEGWRRVFLADPRVGGRFSALAAFGLVPAGLAGADIQQVVDDAASIATSVRSDDEDNPALRLGAALTTAHARGVRTLALAATDDTLAGMPAWLEQLIAESSGKDEIGILPVACESIDAHGFHDAHAATAVCFLGAAVGSRQPISGVAVSYDAPLGAQLLVWQTAVAILCAGIGVNPFDQPDVEDAKVRASALLETADDTGSADEAESTDEDASTDMAQPAEDEPALVDGPVVARTTAEETGASLGDIISDLFPDPDDEDEYLAVQVFLSADHDVAAAALRDLLAQKSNGTVAFGWGPRYLHSTGQFHKGGRPAGSFLFITAESGTAPDVVVPEAGFGFAALQAAQAAGDAQVLIDRGRPVVRLTLTDRFEGLAHLVTAIEGLPDPELRVPLEGVGTDETADEPERSDVTGWAEDSELSDDAELTASTDIPADADMTEDADSAEDADMTEDAESSAVTESSDSAGTSDHADSWGNTEFLKDDEPVSHAVTADGEIADGEIADEPNVGSH